MTLSLAINETLKWLSSLPILMQVILVVTVSGTIGIYSLSLFPHLHTPPPPFSPSLISLMVSVDVKHHVYLPNPQPHLLRPTPPPPSLSLYSPPPPTLTPSQATSSPGAVSGAECFALDVDVSSALTVAV